MVFKEITEDEKEIQQLECPAYECRDDDGNLIDPMEVDEVPSMPLRPTRGGGTRVGGETFNKTELDITTNCGYMVHRDYAAHYFKYAFTQGKCEYKKVLELGCGSKLPLAHVMSMGEQHVPPTTYVGIDYGKINRDFWMKQKWVHAYEKVDATSQECRDFLDEEYGKFDVVVNLEVIEHMVPKKGDELLKTICNSLADDGIAIISTPVFNGYQAKNHIYEYTIEELQEKIERAGMEVVERYGTFASLPDIRKAISEEFGGTDAEAALYEIVQRCREFYNNGVIGAFLAPYFPNWSRNNVWICKRKAAI